MVKVLREIITKEIVNQVRDFVKRN